MINGRDFYNIATAMVPLYVALILAYGSVKWWKIISEGQCSGFNKFVSFFLIPLFCFQLIASNDPFNMNYRFIAADTLQKVIVLVIVAIGCKMSSKGSIEWSITLFSLLTLPNTVVMGIPLLRAMYGEDAVPLMVQIMVLQSLIWYTVMLILLEYRSAKLLISEQFPDTAHSIKSFKVDSDVMSLDGKEPLVTQTEVGEDGYLHVKVSRSSSVRSDLPYFSDVDMYSVSSSMNWFLRESSFNHHELSLSMNDRGSGGVVRQVKSRGAYASGGEQSRVCPMLPMSAAPTDSGNRKGGGRDEEDGRVFVRSSSAPPISREVPHVVHGTVGGDGSDFKGYDGQRRNGQKVQRPTLLKLDSVTELGHDSTITENEPKPTSLPSSVMARLIFSVVWRKLIKNPNIYLSVVGITWSLISYRWHIQMPKIIDASIKILSNAGLGMAMASLGLFMALQPKMIACGKTKGAMTMVARFLIGPAVMAASSIIVGLRGDLLRIAIVQAVLPAAIVPCVFANEYNVHADIQSTAVIFGMLIAMPFLLVYYILLGLMH